MQCTRCGMSFRNSVHSNNNQWGYHAFVEPPQEPRVPTLEERVGELERRLAELEGEK